MNPLRRPRRARIRRRAKRHQVNVPIFAFHPRPWWEWVILAGFWLAITGALGLGAWSFLHEDWRVRVEAELPTPPSAAFAAFDEPARRLAWEPGVVAITPLVGDGRQTGDTRLVFLAREGRRWQEEERILERRPPRRLSLERHGPLRDVRIAIEIAPLQKRGASGSRLVWDEKVRYHDPLDRLFGWWRAHERHHRLERALVMLPLAGSKVSEGKRRRITGSADIPP